MKYFLHGIHAVAWHAKIHTLIFSSTFPGVLY